MKFSQDTLHSLPEKVLSRVKAEPDTPCRIKALCAGKKADAHTPVQRLQHIDLKKAGIAAGGAAVVFSALSLAGRYKFYRSTVSHELSRQLAPLNQKLDMLQEENRRLQEELSQLRAETQSPESDA